MLDKDKRKEIEAEIVERRTDAVLIATTPEDYGKEVRFFRNAAIIIIMINFCAI